MDFWVLLLVALRVALHDKTSTRDVEKCTEVAAAWRGQCQQSAMVWHAMLHLPGLAIGAIGLAQPTKHHLKPFTNTFLTLLSPEETFSLLARRHHWWHGKLLLYLSRLPGSPGNLCLSRIRRGGLVNCSEVMDVVGHFKMHLLETSLAHRSTWVSWTGWFTDSVNGFLQKSCASKSLVLSIMAMNLDGYEVLPWRQGRTRSFGDSAHSNMDAVVLRFVPLDNWYLRYLLYKGMSK